MSISFILYIENRTEYVRFCFYGGDYEGCVRLQCKAVQLVKSSMFRRDMASIFGGTWTRRHLEERRSSLRAFRSLIAISKWLHKLQHKLLHKPLLTEILSIYYINIINYIKVTKCVYYPQITNNHASKLCDCGYARAELQSNKCGEHSERATPPFKEEILFKNT